jgi:hypothetical protein
MRQQNYEKATRNQSQMYDSAKKLNVTFGGMIAIRYIFYMINCINV